MHVYTRKYNVLSVEGRMSSLYIPIVPIVIEQESST